MDAYAGQVDELGDVDVAGYGDEGVGVGAAEGGVGGAHGGAGEEGDHVANGHLGGALEVLVEAHGDVGGGGDGARPFEPVGGRERVRCGGFVEDELEGAGELGFERGDVDLAVSLVGVAVADLEVGAPGVDGEEDCGAGDEVLVVHVAAVHPGRGGVGAAAGGDGDAHGPEEGVQWDVDAGGEVADHLLAVKRDELLARVGEVVGEEAAADAEAVAGPRDVYVDLLDADFEDVAGGCAFNRDGAGEEVAAGAAVGGVGLVVEDGLDPGGDVGGGDAAGDEILGVAAGGEGLDGDGVAGVDGEGGFEGAAVGSPDDGVGGGEEGFGLGLGAGGVEGEGGEDKCGGGVDGGSCGGPCGADQSGYPLRYSFGKVLIRRNLCIE
jgi:hypothetical protein